MLNVLIIDDEPSVRAGLKKIIKWEQNGFSVCGEGIDGDDGYNKIMKLKPDLVLMDINMPGMFGIDVIKKSQQNGFNGKFIIITGYSDFQYAKSAITYGVKAYILKPIDEDELTELIVSLGEEINREKDSEKNVAVSKKYLRELTFKQLILGESKEKIDLGNLEFDTDNLKVEVALVSNSKYNNNAEMYKLEKMVSEQIGMIENLHILILENFIALVYINFSMSHIMKTLNKLEEKLDKKTFITLGKEEMSLEKVQYSYLDAKELMKKKFLFFEYRIISKEIIEKIMKESLKEYEDIELNNLYSYVEINDIEKLVKCFLKFANNLRREGYSEEKVKIVAINKALELREKIINDYNIKKEEITDSNEVMEEFYQKTSLNETIDYLAEQFINLSEKVSNISTDSTMKRIINYINKNYYNDLKLELLAQIFNYNSAYLGKAFKNYVGENFNTYLDKVRIEKAKVLLMEDKLKVYQVSEKVGYKNIDYFHGKFKKYVGTSPLNYKKQLENK